MKKVLSNKLFMATFVSDMLSNFGDIVYYFAMMAYVLQLPNTNIAISLVTFSESLPILSKLLMSIWGDRTKNKLDTILWTLMLRIVLYSIVGFAMGFTPSFWILGLALLVNVCSDLAGQYENALFTPISLRIVTKEDREGMFAFRQAVSSVLYMLFQASGAFFITVLTFSQLAYFNASTFLISATIMLIIRGTLKQKLDENPIVTVNKEGSETVFESICSSLKLAYSSLDSIPEVKQTLISIMGMNAIVVVEEPLFLLIVKHNPAFGFGNPMMTLALMTLASVLGNVTGSILLSKLKTDLSFAKMTMLSSFFILTLFLGYLMQTMTLILISGFLMCVIVGMINPKFFALLSNTVPENQLATIEGGIGSFTMIGMLLSRLIIALMVLLLSTDTISVIFVLLALLLLGTL